ncbi:caspase family protein [Bacteroides heparinolyticus]|uniref:caspase family protein n=1 Tax=Prevotella heparinolytica TaxID=28113 RepID=UPI0035A050B2
MKVRLSFFFMTMAMFLCIQVEAQTYYELAYKNRDGRQCYGFMIYEDDDNCTMRIITVNDNNEISDADDIKYVSVDDKDNGEYTALCPEEQSDVAPNIVFLWKEYKGDDDIQPVICFDLEEADFNLPESFTEVDLADIDTEYLQQFYDTNEDMYRAIMEAKREIRHQQSAIADKLGDGSDIFRTVMTLLAEAGADVDQEDIPEITEDSRAEGDVTLHLMTVINTEVNDIGQACERDYFNILNEMKGISKTLGIRLKTYAVMGDAYSRDNVVRTLNSLQPGSDDIVFFIYSGHGFRFDNQTSKYPCFDLTTSQYDDVEDDNYLQMSDIYNEICGKEARLNIVLSDCCNTPIGVEAPYREVGTLFSRSSNNYSVKRLGQLFLQARGSLISTAASPGETSVCDMTGGYFTLSFIRSLRKEINAVNQQSVSWENIINNTIAAARQRGQEVGNRQQGLKLIKIRQ